MGLEQNDVLRNAPSSVETANINLPLLIGDGLHVMNPEVYKAICREDAGLLQSFMQKQLEAGAKAVAVNLGPGREIGKHTAWVVDTLLQKRADIQLFFSANILQHQGVLRRHGRRITINAISANQDELQATFQVANTYGCSVVVLLTRAGKPWLGVGDKLVLAGEVLAQAAACDFPRSRLYLDPVLASRPDPVSLQMGKGYPDISSAIETISLVKDLDQEVKTIVALGTCSGKIQRAGHLANMLRVFMGGGVDGVLLNCKEIQEHWIAGLNCEELLAAAV